MNLSEGIYKIKKVVLSTYIEHIQLCSDIYWWFVEIGLEIKVNIKVIWAAYM